MSIVSIVKALLARLLFVVHGFIAVFRVVTVLGDAKYWFLGGGIALLFFESLISMCCRAGRELEWFSPSVFLYLCCAVPSIWFLELDQAAKRIYERGEDNSTNLTSTFIKIDFGGDLPPGLSDDFNEYFSGITDEMSTLLRGVEDYVSLSNETWIQVIEQLLLVILIFGRWLLPKGNLSRDQLSQLLLVYIGMAADIVEFFEAFKEPEVRFNMILICVILSIWSWSLLQFTLVLTGARKTRGGTSSTKKKKKKKKKKKVRPPEASRYYIDAEAGVVDDDEEEELCCKCCPCCSTDICAITITILLQDGPFLVLRLVLIIHYHVVSYMNIFFTCKNALVTILQLYRIAVLCCGGGEEKPTPPPPPPRKPPAGKKPQAPRQQQMPRKTRSYPQTMENSATQRQTHGYGHQGAPGRGENGYDGRAPRQKRSSSVLPPVGETDSLARPHSRHSSQQSLSQRSAASYGSNLATGATHADGGDLLAPPPPSPSRSNSLSGVGAPPSGNGVKAPRSQSLVPPADVQKGRRSRSPKPNKKRSPSPRKR